MEIGVLGSEREMVPEGRAVVASGAAAPRLIDLTKEEMNSGQGLTETLQGLELDVCLRGML